MKINKAAGNREVSRTEQRFDENMIGPNISFAVSEAYKLLRTNLLFSFSGDQKSHVVGVTSSFRSALPAAWVISINRTE